MADTSLIESNIGLLVWKTSNFWQSKVRKILFPYKLTLNEFLILKGIYLLSKKKENIYQNEVSNFIGIDASVTSVTLKLLENKKFIFRQYKTDNRKKNIFLIKDGINLFNIIHPLFQKEEEKLFNKLNIETFNFTNSLKLILGKKLRIKAEKKY
jgi:DNA-binding MarR family transcriptional regulator